MLTLTKKRQRILEEIETKLTRTIGVVKSVIVSLKSSLESEIKALIDKVDSLSLRVAKLESIQSPHPVLPDHSSAGDLERLHSQIKQLTDSMNNHQKLEERANSANNLVMVGVEEDEEMENTPVFVIEGFGSKMGLNSVNIVQARRLGR